MFLDREGHGIGRNKEFSETHKFIGGVPIFVDSDVRDEVIPKATQQVEKLMTGVKRIDRYAPSDSTNKYVESVK